MQLIVGLGNPGSEYISTRHNLGFLVVDALADYTGTKFRPGKGAYWYAPCSLKDTSVTLLKPVTYMNESGIALVEFLSMSEIPIENILVVCDDFQIPFGTLRLCSGGSNGGHNGLGSIIYQLQNDQFPRLRCGIGSVDVPKDKSRMKEFVLESFPEDQFEEVAAMIKNARDACISFVTDGIERTMNRFNAKPFKEEI